jgi:membrane protease YdiL (CAAX protease family)
VAKSVAESAPSAPAAAVVEPGGYQHWSRDPAVGLFAVLPLWLLYEATRLRLAPAERNGAEVLLLHELHRLGDRAHLVVSVAFCCLMLYAARSLVRRDVPWLRVAAVIALEGTVYALMLGPIAEALTSSTVRMLAAGTPLAGNLVGALGAGIFEELVFRLGLMSVLVWVGLRAARSWSLPSWVAGVSAVLVSALVFSWFHHVCGEPFDRNRFVFRTMAGILLGLLMWARGYGVCVYTHSIYNVYYYLSQDGV